MDEDRLPLGRLWIVGAVVTLVIALVIACSLALLHRWQLPPGGAGGAAGIVQRIPPPRLQTAPQDERAGQTPAPEFEQRLGARLPTGLHLVDASGQTVDWQALAASGHPLVLLPAYYRCDTLCGTVAHGALEALADTGLAPDAWHLLLFSIDPADRPADARVLQAVYADYAAWARPAVYARHPPDLRLLTSGAADAEAL
ncbi:MAG TPA: hypothetical protein VGI11_08070, partial [Variovorax sp.]